MKNIEESLNISRNIDGLMNMHIKSEKVHLIDPYESECNWFHYKTILMLRIVN